jgi:hypothetical protein
MKLQDVGFQRDSSKEFEHSGVQLCQILAGVPQHEKAGNRHPKDEGMHWIVHELVRHPSKGVPLNVQKQIRS